MVNLLVVAALLVPSLAEDRLAVIKDLTVFCKQKDGNHTAMSNMTIVLRPLSGMQTDSEMLGIGSDEWKTYLEDNAKSILASHKTDQFGQITGNHEKSYSSDDKLMVQLFIECNELRRICPGIENICVRGHFEPTADGELARDISAYAYNIEYERNKNAFSNSYLLLKGHKTFHTASEPEIDDLPMTEEEFCGKEYEDEGIVVFERPGCSCSGCRQSTNVTWSENRRSNSILPEYHQTIEPDHLREDEEEENGAATAGFVAFLALLAIALI